MRREEMAIFALLAEFGLLGVGEGVVRLIGSNYYRDMLQKHRGQIDEALHLHMGMPFRLELIEGEPVLPDTPSLRQIERQRQEALQAEVLQEARTHPQIQALLAQFEGQLRGSGRWSRRRLVSNPGAEWRTRRAPEPWTCARTLSE
ncbi:hypothetical protein OV079_37680 [Nannocystis pusilla]|uniref:Uncharacterized protein n=1 Tax=Nannocystis pusilla TaxID=889268 RepID=A0A9X3EX89_9BACT|nr:hypothetical protein [Nannocystis pusilla]MCY1011195.1 hypothetical protein [Nannocystis pusilla]